MGIFESMAYIMLLGVIAAAWLVSFAVDKIFGLGYRPWLSTVIGSVVGIVILFISPTKGGVIAMIAAGVCALISSIVQEKVM